MTPPEPGWKNALIGGLAPASWQEEVALAATSLDGLKRASAWIDSWDLEIQLWQDYGPLFGYTLAWLVEDIDADGMGQDQPRFERELADFAQRGLIPPFGNRKALDQQHSSGAWTWQSVIAADRSRDKASSREVVRESKPSFTSFDRPIECEARQDKPNWRQFTQYEETRREVERKTPAVSSWAVRTSENMPSPSSMAIQIDETVLSRLAGGLILTRDLHRQQPIGRVPLKRRENNLAPSIDLRSGRNWLEDLSKRAMGSLGRLQRELFLPAGQAALTGQRAMKRPNSVKESSLEGQWSRPLGGLRAPADLLARFIEEHGASFGHDQWLEPSGYLGRAAAAEVQGGSAAEEPGNSFRPAIAGQSSSARETRKNGMSNIPATVTEEHLNILAEIAKRNQEILQPMAPHQASNASNGLIATFKTSQPRAKRSLSGHLTARETATTPSTAVATREYGLHSEQGDPSKGSDEDLSALAVKIKRILDEEARRHGINI